MMTISDTIIQKIIRRLLKGEDYRIEVVTLINAEFLQYAIDFFQRIVEAKMRNQAVITDWYKEEFLNPNLHSDDLIINAGLNKKTISNMYNSVRREIVLEATEQHYHQLYKAISSLIQHGSELDISLTIKFRGVSVDLNINESLIVINTLAVKRAELRGGAWSTAGKQVEKALMLTLCTLYQVPKENYKLVGRTQEQREVDFYLIDGTGKKYHCEVKLMGKGNPESADTTMARDTNVLVADKLSELNKQQLSVRGVRWIELRSKTGYRKFAEILQELGIPHSERPGELEVQLDAVFKVIF
jgi:hypothetical protein